MPYISIDVSKKLTDEEKMVICKKMGKVMEEIPEKDESRLVVAVRDEVFMTFKGEKVDTAYFNALIYGTCTFDAKKNFTEAAFKALSEVTGIPNDQMYLNFSETNIWGLNGTLK